MSVADADEHTTDRAMRKITLALWLIATPALGQQITAFPAASTPLAGTEQIYLVQAGQPRQTTVGNLFNVSGPFLPLAGNKTVTGPVTFSGTLSATAGINATPYVAIGVPGATTGQIFLSNTTGGILTLQAPATGMLGSDVLTIPIPAGSTDTFALLGTPESFTAATTFTTTVVMSGQPTACTGIEGSKKLANVCGTLTVC